MRKVQVGEASASLDIDFEDPEELAEELEIQESELKLDFAFLSRLIEHDSAGKVVLQAHE